MKLIAAKQAGGGGPTGGRKLGEHPDGGALSVNKGRFGPYVAWGKVFATIPKSMSEDEISLEQAIELVNAKASASGKKGPKATAKKASPKKTPAKKTAAKKTAAKKPTEAKKIEDADDAPFAGGKPAQAAPRKPAATKAKRK